MSPYLNLELLVQNRVTSERVVARSFDIVELVVLPEVELDTLLADDEVDWLVSRIGRFLGHPAFRFFPPGGRLQELMALPVEIFRAEDRSPRSAP
ncbi:unnamed protein product [Umbelopsis sp. WA50703]